MADAGPGASPLHRQRSEPSLARVRALFIVNVQNDFFFDGTGPVRGSDAIIPVINRLRARDWTHVFVTGLHRPPDHWYARVVPWHVDTMQPLPLALAQLFCDEQTWSEPW